MTVAFRPMLRGKLRWFELALPDKRLPVVALAQGSRTKQEVKL